MPAEKTKKYEVKCLRGSKVCLKPQINEKEKEWNRRIKDKKSIIAIDLFCGAGGLSLGFEQSGIFVAAAIDSDKYSCETYAGNFIAKTFCMDITRINKPSEFFKSIGIERIDLIIGGPPCQGFSTEGRGKIRNLKMLDKYHRNKNLLYRHFIRFVEDIKPLFFLMENVPGMENFYSENGEIFSNKVENDFKKIGYKVERKLLNAVDYGVPQTRRRLFFQGSRASNEIKWPYKQSSHFTLFDAIGDLPFRKPPCLTEEQKYNSKSTTSYQKLMRSKMQNGRKNIIYDHVIRPVREDDKVIFNLLPEGGTYADVPEKHRRYRCDIFKDKYRKLNWSKPAYTVTAHMSKDGYRYIHPDKKQTRTLSLREVARIQSFPDYFRFTGYRTNRFIQVGNAVPPLLSEAIAKEVKKSILKFRYKKTKNQK